MKTVQFLVVAMMLLGALVQPVSVSAQTKGGKDAPARKEKEDGKKDAKPGEDEQKEEVKAIDLPWTVDELKKAVKKGRKHKYKYTATLMGSETTLWYIEEITEVTESGYKEKVTELNSKGKGTGTEWENDRKWTDYLGHTFTTKNTKTSEEKIKVKTGEYSCKVFEQTEKGEDVTTVKKWYLAKDKPGVIPKQTSESDIQGAKTTSVYELDEVS